MKLTPRYLTLAILLLFFSAESLSAEKSSISQPNNAVAKVGKKPKKPRRFPLACYHVGFQYEGTNLILKPYVVEDTATLYFIHNISPQTLYLESVKPADDLYGATYHTHISPGRWAAFAFDYEQILFTCTQGSEKGGAVVDCSTALDICQFPCVIFGQHNGGNYWVSENLGMVETINTANWGTGILLKSCPKSVRDQISPPAVPPTPTTQPVSTPKPQ